jgi:Carboxypeptidase regulatory-like domain
MRYGCAFFLLACSMAVHALVPPGASAQGATQASITGVVRDASGAVLPGVTVEASSAALIEKERTAVTDATGRFRIVSLPPGTYAVTFTLVGFSPARREGIELTGSFTATVNVDLKVGAIEETVTVTGETPIVDVQSAQRQQVLKADIVSSIPASRSYEMLAALVPGITLNTNAQNVGGINGPAPPFFGGHGGAGTEGRLNMDGIGTGGATGGVSLLIVDTGNAAEVTVSTTGGLADAEIGGPVINVVPRSGGNQFSGQFFGAGAGPAMQSDNFTQELKDAGLLSPSKLEKVWDVNLAVGGPIKRDKLWFYATTRNQGSYVTVSNTYFNKNAGDPNAWSYVPDLSHQSENDSWWKSSALRLTWQASPRNKIAAFWDEQSSCQRCVGGGSPTTAPEASAPNDIRWMRAYQTVWTSPISNRVLLEAAFSGMGFSYGREKEGNNRDLIQVMDQTGPITYRSMNWRPAVSWTPRVRASMSYVSGQHNVKVGFDQMDNFSDRIYLTNNQGLFYRFNNGAPNRLTMIINNFRQQEHVRGGAVYGQDQWTIGRLTAQGGLRYDYGSADSPEQIVGPDLWIPTPIVFPAQDLVRGYRDLSLRGGMAYDLFGNGKTSLKFNAGRYVDTVQWSGIYADTNPTLSSLGPGTAALPVPQNNRSWTDRNNDKKVDCDLFNPQANGECGTSDNVNFGKVQNPTSTYDQALLGGWRIRPHNTQIGASIQQQLWTRVSLEVGYAQRWFPTLTAIDNRAVTPADYSPYSVTAPLDARLPNGGGYVIGDQWDISPALFGRTDNYVTFANSFGGAGYYWHGVDTNVSARLTGGLTVQGGTSSGRKVTDSCSVGLADSNGNLTVDNPGRRNCSTKYPFLTDYRGLASYTISKIDVQISATLQSRSGPELLANANVPSATVAQSLGRPLAGGAANVTINLLNAGQMYGDRVTQLDFRVAKILRFGKTRTNVGLDFYNVTNSSTTLTYNNTYGATWLTPQTFMPARFVKITGQFNF